MNEILVQKTKDFVKEFFSGDCSGHDYFHTLRVYNLARNMAQKEGGDVEICCLSALLHDVDDFKISPETYKNKLNAVNFLKANNYDEEKIKIICHIIGQVSFLGEKDIIVPDTLEGMIVQDADRLDAVGAIGIARAFAYGGSHNREIYNPDVKPSANMSKEDYMKNKSSSINHFYEKLLLLKNYINTKTGKIIAEKRTKLMEDYLENFFAEWNGTDTNIMKKG